MIAGGSRAVTPQVAPPGFALTHAPRLARAGLGVVVFGLVACSSGDTSLGPAAAPAVPTAPVPATAPADHAGDLAALDAFEDARRAAARWDALPPASAVLGADPYRLVAVPGAAELVGLERGAAAVVLLDDAGRELDRATGPARPSAVAVAADGTIYVGGADPAIATFTIDRAQGTPRLVARGSRRHPSIGAVRALAAGPDRTLYAADDETGVIAAWRDERPVGPPVTCRVPIGLTRVGDRLLSNCLVDHEVTVWRLDRDGAPRAALAAIRHDGPIWSMAGVEVDGALWLALGGVEDHPLERADGTFGYVDSFLFLYRVDGRGGATRTAEVNLGELGVITPKALGLSVIGGELVAIATGYGGDQMAELSWPRDGRGAPRVALRSVMPGITALVPGQGARPTLAANPLFDAWMTIGPDHVALRRAPTPPGAAARTVESRVGELLAFTHLMAPWAPTEGKASRFTCETCHFEGGIDGRVHFTGRGTVHATTKPLFGLFSNRPHFTRALDLTMAEMVNNEFRVATRSSGRDPWFALDASVIPWLDQIEGAPERLDPVALRRALMAFLMDFNHEPSRAVAGRAGFDARERRGATLFRDRCAACHAARLVTDRADTEVPFERWEALIFASTGPIVWARDGHVRTGVEPYVHDDGARTTSLRRLARKQPYFTNGSARTLAAVLERVAWQGDRFFHDQAPADAIRLDDEARRDLAAFLALL